MPCQYTFCGHAHTCVAGGHLVFLDIDRDKYLCLDLETTATLLPYLRGRSFVFRDTLPFEGATRSTVTHILTELQQRNLIALLPFDQAPLSVEQAAVPTRSICGVTGNKHHRTAGGACEVLLAVTRSAVMLRWRTLAKTVSHVTQRRRSAAVSSADVGDESLVQRFASFRSAFGKADACLPNSLALLDFLAIHGRYPKLVFGVSMRPFQAHCWVQHEGTVLGDTLERVSRFTPIMVV